jgi:beta-mannosidase
MARMDEVRDVCLDRWKLGWTDGPADLRPHPAEEDFVDHFWLSVRVPGDVHSALIEAGLLDPPYFGHNDLKARWVEDKVWWYRTELEVPEAPAPGERWWLEFEGIDTFATVYVGGLEIASSENQFVPLSLDVTRVLRPGRNVVCVRIDPVRDRVAGKRLHSWAGFAKERAWVRKAQMSWGWDWAPRLVTAGLWRPVWLRRRKGGRLTSLWVRTAEVAGEGRPARLDIEAETEVWAARDAFVRMEVTDADGCTVWRGRAPVDGGKAKVSCDISQARLWWTHDLGTPYLYNLRCQLVTDGRVVDERHEAFGIRTVRLCTERDGRPAFTFELNGVPLFAKGANWIPVDCFYASVPDARYEQLIALAKGAHMNMLRVWGGGIYERDAFYRLCDREGLLVWQDFMFACALYPDYNQAFWRSVEAEIDAVVRRLRNHPCLALWCGNNENDWLYEMLRSSGGADEPFYGERIWHELIPQRLAVLDPDRPYWPSSPYGGNDHNSAEAGDRHNWQVWHGHVYPRRFGEPERIDYSVEGVSFKHYAEDTARFVSEFGMHASANRYTLARWLPPGSLVLGHPELEYRNKDFHPEKGLLLMAGYTGEPTDFDSYLAYSMLTQAEGLRFGVEHYRRRKFEASGTLIWQLNDSWPGTSWSIIDYHLLPKAAYYYAKRFYHPVLWSLAVQPGRNAQLWGINDTLEDLEGHIRLEVRTWDGQVIKTVELPVHLAPGAVAHFGEWTETDLLGQCDPREVAVLVVPVGVPGPRQVLYLRDHKDMRWPACSVRWHADPDACRIVVETDRHARFVQMEFGQPAVVASDNFFDLPAGERIEIKIQSLAGEPIRWDAIRVHALNGRRDG